MSMSQRLLEFHDLDQWVQYAMENMRRIRAERQELDGIEIHLVAKRGVIGKWQESSNYGFIEEARTDERLLEERQISV
jgi:hypothetical protein